MSSLYGFVVFDCGVSPDYFLDEMQPFEVSALSEAYYKTYKEKWEITRSVIHAIYSSQSTKPIDPLKIMRFNWDKETQKELPKLSETDRERLKKKYNIK